MTALERLLAVVSRHSSAIVALSGGVDSATVTAAARKVLGGRVLAVTSASASVATAEVDMARQIAAELDVAHRVVQTAELEDPEYVKNSAQRCYHCKRALYTRVTEIAASESYGAVFNGTNVDDLRDFRPGLRAAKELGVLSPLVEAQLDKRTVREVARLLGVRIWAKPADACLASRLPHGTLVTLERLDQVGRAEEALSRLGFYGHRVRHHGEVARLEIREEQIGQAFGMRNEVVRDVAAAGYRYVSLDLEGYRTGSLNPVPE